VWVNSWQALISKITIANWTGDVAQAIEHQLYKCDAQSSNPNSTKKKKKKKGKKEKKGKSFCR
jgi:hypothetical protein